MTLPLAILISVLVTLADTSTHEIAFKVISLLVGSAMRTAQVVPDGHDISVFTNFATALLAACVVQNVPSMIAVARKSDFFNMFDPCLEGKY
jgi:hypothetical protein